MVTINGKEENVAGQSILSYLESNGYSPEKVVIELNLEIIDRDQLSNVILKDNDSLEVLRFVGGG